MNTNSNGPLIVGFGHRRRMGKDALADLVWRRLVHAKVKPARDAFARKLKKAAFRIFAYGGLLEPQQYDHNPELREKMLTAIGKSPRDIWIEFGTKVREIAPDAWIRSVLDAPVHQNAEVLLITDVRYPNEITAIRERGGLVIKVARPGVPKSGDVADSALARLPDAEWDMVVANGGDLAALVAKADGVAGFILERLTTRRMAGRKPPERMTVAIDFDGVLCRPDWPRIGKEIPGAVSFLHWLGKQNVQPVLWTARNGHLLDAALAWLAARGFPKAWWSAINDSPADVKAYYGDEGRKAGCDCFVDDRNACFPARAGDPGVPDWPRIKEDIVRRQAEFTAARV